MVNRIAAIRAEKGLGLSEIARLAKTTPAQIQKLERGERRLTVEWMQRLSAAMGVMPSELLSVADVETLGTRTGSLAAILESFPGAERAIAEEAATEFLELLLRYRGALVSVRSPRKPAGAVLSEDQLDMARTLIRLSRSLAVTLSDSGPGSVRRRRTGR